MNRALSLGGACAILAFGTSEAFARQVVDVAPVVNGVKALLPAAAPKIDRRPTVMFKVRGRGESTMRAVARRHGLRVMRTFPQIGWVEAAYGSRLPATLRRVLRADRVVTAVDVPAPGEGLRPLFQPRDTAFDLVSGDGLPAQWHYTATNFQAAWDKSRGAATVVLGVIDSEFYTENPELKIKMRAGYNTNSGTPEYHTSNLLATSQADLHGSHVAGLMAAATDNAQGVAGAGFDSTILPVRTFMDFTPGGGAVDAKFVADLTEALLWLADRGVAAINLSLGTSRPHKPMEDALKYAYAKGVTLVASAGNHQDEPTTGTPVYPAAYPHVFAVAATAPPDGRQITAFSANGDWVDISAPGERIFSTWDPRDTPLGTPGGHLELIPNDPGAYATLQGTSMAAPIVTGLVGLIKSARPELTPDEVMAIISLTARDLGAQGKDQIFGFGLIDASRAVNAAISYIRRTPPQTGGAGGGTAPAGSSRPVKSSRPSVRGRRVVFPLRCGSTSISCSGTAKVTLGGRRRASKTFVIAGGNRTALTVRLSNSDVRRLRRGRSLRFVVTITASDQSGRRSTTRTGWTLR